jgi:hypothetical protein
VSEAELGEEARVVGDLERRALAERPALAEVGGEESVALCD